MFLRNAVAALLIVCPPVIWAQEEKPAANFSDPVALLEAVAQTYASAADIFHIELIQESAQVNHFEKDWRRTEETAIKGPRNLYRIEARTAYGSFLEVSDGASEWLYSEDAKLYVKRPVPQNWPGFPRAAMGGEMELMNAWNLRTSLESTAAKYNHATMLPAKTIDVEGHKFRCYVVHVTSADSTGKPNARSTWEDTFWIDREALVFRKIEEHMDMAVMVGPKVRVPMLEDSTTVYPVVDFRETVDANLFRFDPPAGAQGTASLEWDNKTAGAANPGAKMVGKTAPDVTLTAEDGKTVALSSLRGKPVLLDLWATWCGPCLESMPALGRIARDVHGQGVMVVSVDQDTEAEDATRYLARHGYGWPNYHDPDGKVMKAFEDQSIPLTVLIDAHGKIVYYDYGGDEEAVRKAIAGLGD
jgi:thiol-disulfide isomerase/thioredoxin/outer membrane lipoprotein-sorting protein